MGSGVEARRRAYRRLGESFEALRSPPRQLDNYRKAMALDHGYALRLQHKVINLQLDQDDPAPAEASLDEYLKDNAI